jgi:hypothetical protein
MKPSWGRRRTTFNHDWLQNYFVISLSRFLNLLRNVTEDPEYERTFVPTVLTTWEAERENAKALIEDFEREMSPRQLFQLPPLSRCSEETQRWLPDLIESLWLSRNKISELVATADCAYNQADASYERLRQTLELRRADTQSADSLRPFFHEFAEFRERCQDLARALSNFPREVKVV